MYPKQSFYYTIQGLGNYPIKLPPIIQRQAYVNYDQNVYSWVKSNYIKVDQRGGKTTSLGRLWQGQVMQLAFTHVHFKDAVLLLQANINKLRDNCLMTI